MDGLTKCSIELAGVGDFNPWQGLGSLGWLGICNMQMWTRGYASLLIRPLGKMVGQLLQQSTPHALLRAILA